jgi:hypothetical protein
MSREKRGKLEKGLPMGLGKMRFEQFRQLQEKYCSNFLCGYMRDPTIIKGKDGGPDYVNALCALMDDKKYVCTRRLPADLNVCQVYKENERQWKLQEELRQSEENYNK